MMMKYIYGYFLFALYIIISICANIPGNGNTSGHNNKFTTGKLKIDKHGEILRRYPKSRRPIYPEHLSYTLELPDGDVVSLNATKIENVQLDLHMSSSSGETSFLNLRGKAFYRDNNMPTGGVFMLGAEETNDGTLLSKLSGTFINKGKKCITTEENLTCLKHDTETDTFHSYINDTPPIPDFETNNTERQQGTSSKGTNRSRRNVEKVADYDTTNVIQLIVMVDSVWMAIFRERNNNNEIEARNEAGIYLIGLIVELNLWYRSIGEVSRSDPNIQDYELVVYLKRVLYPDQGEEWSFVRRHLVGDGGWKVHDTSRCWFSVCDGLTAFGNWVGNNINDVYFDHVAFISSRTLYYDNSPNLLGIAYLDSVCSSDDRIRVSINSDGAIDVVSTLGHELGHGLGARHDGERGCPEDRYLMSTILAQVNAITRYTYRNLSVCSVRDIANHLNSNGNCLQARSSGIANQFTDMLCEGPRGPTFGVDFQCDRLSEESTLVCASSVLIRDSDGAKMVSELACWDDSIVQCASNNGACINLGIDVVTDGTPCGSSVEDIKICYRGECVDEEQICTTTTSTTTTTTTSTTSSTSSTTTPTPTTTTSTTTSTTSSTSSTTTPTPTTTTSTTTSSTTTTSTTSTTTPTLTKDTIGCSCVNISFSRYSCCRLNRKDNGECCDGCLRVFFWFCYPS